MQTATRIRSLVIAASVLSAVALANRSPAESSTRPANCSLTDAQHTQVEAQARAFIERYLRTLEGGDEDAISELYVTDERFAWFTDGTERYSSVDEILDGLCGLGGAQIETTLSAVRVLPLTPRLASVRSGFSTHMVFAPGSEVTFGGIITWLIEKAADEGPWRVVFGHTSTPGGPPDDR